MKLIINYDLMDAIRNVNEPLSPFKIVRNEKKCIATFLPFWLFVGFLSGSGSIPHCLGVLSVQLGMSVGGTYIVYNNLDYDKYAISSSDNLKKLSQQLNDLHIQTDYDLLLKSKVYEKKHKIEFNEKNIPFIAEEKYILVPTYNYNCDVKDTSILQEHVVGSKEYVLSLGSPKKEHKLAYSNT